MDTLMKIEKKITMIFGVLFCFELVFGYTGTMIMVHGIAIRHLLFIPTFLGMYLFCLLYIIKNKIPLFKSKEGKKSIVASMRVLDWVMLAFIFSTALSLFVIPQFMGGSFKLAKAEGLDTLCMLFLYYPVRFMIEWKEFNLGKFEKYIYWLVFALSVIHLVLYFGQTYNNTFIEGYFNILSKLSFGTSIVPTIILGHGGYPRVMFSTSIYILVGFYLLLKKMPNWKFYDYIAFFIEAVAMMTTMTKSIWFGFFGGIAVFSVLYIIECIKKKDKLAVLQLATVFLCAAVLIVTLDKTFFNNMISIRLGNSFATSYEENPSDESGENEERDEKENELNRIDNQGAALSNTIKIEQTKELLKKWKQSPVFGFGYGSYVEGYLRSEESVFSYEMQFPALLMKTGIIGMGLLIALLILMFVSTLKSTKDNKTKLYAWLYLLGSLGLCVQTNPLLLSFTGISVVLLIMYGSICDTDFQK